MYNWVVSRKTDLSLDRMKDGKAMGMLKKTSFVIFNETLFLSQPGKISYIAKFKFQDVYMKLFLVLHWSWNLQNLDMIRRLQDHLWHLSNYRSEFWFILKREFKMFFTLCSLTISHARCKEKSQRLLFDSWAFFFFICKRTKIVL